MEKIVRKRMKELGKERATLERKKVRVSRRVSKLHDRLNQNTISMGDYMEEVAILNNNINELDNTIDYYTRNMEKTEAYIEERKKEVRREKIEEEVSKIGVAAVIVLLTFGIFLVSEGTSLGFLTMESTSTYDQEVNIADSRTGPFWEIGNKVIIQQDLLDLSNPYQK